MVYNSNSGIVNRNNGGIYNSGNTSDPYQSTGNVKIQKELKELDTRIDILETNFNNYTEATDADIVRIENNTDALESDINDINTRVSSAEVSIEGYQQNFDTVNLTAENAVFHEIGAGKYTFDHGFAITGTTICRIAEGSQVWVTDGTNSILIDYTNKDAWVAKAKTTDGNKFRLYENGVLTFTASGGWSVYVIGNDIELASASGNYSEINTGVTVGGTLTALYDYIDTSVVTAHNIQAANIVSTSITSSLLNADGIMAENVNVNNNLNTTRINAADATINNLTNSKRNIQKDSVNLLSSGTNVVNYIGIPKFTGTYDLKLSKQAGSQYYRYTTGNFIEENGQLKQLDFMLLPEGMFPDGDTVTITQGGEVVYTYTYSDRDKNNLIIGFTGVTGHFDNQTKFGLKVDNNGKCILTTTFGGVYQEVQTDTEFVENQWMSLIVNPSIPEMVVKFYYDTESVAGTGYKAKVTFEYPNVDYISFEGQVPPGGEISGASLYYKHEYYITDDNKTAVINQAGTVNRVTTPPNDTTFTIAPTQYYPGGTFNLSFVEDDILIENTSDPTNILTFPYENGTNYVTFMEGEARAELIINNYGYQFEFTIYHSDGQGGWTQVAIYENTGLPLVYEPITMDPLVIPTKDIFTATIIWNGSDPIVKYYEYSDREPIDYLYSIVLTKKNLYFAVRTNGTLYYSWDAMGGATPPTNFVFPFTGGIPESVETEGVIANYIVDKPNRTVFFGDHSTESGVDILGELNADWIKYPDGFSVDNFTVHETLTVEGDTTTRTLNVNDDSNFGGEATFEDDVTIHGDLYVTGTTTTTSEAQVSSSGNYLVTRDNNNSPMLEGEYSGVAVNNYDTGKIATLTADHEGTWRVSDSATSTAHTYTNISAWNGNFYSGLSQTTATGPTGILTNVDADELASVVLNGTDYYHKAGNDWYGPITLVDNKLSIGSIVTDQTLIDTLDSLTKNDLIYYRSVTDKSIDTSTNQPLLTRSEVDDLSGNHILKWDSTNNKAIDSGVSATTANNVTSVTADQFCGALKGNADTATNATCSQYVKRTGVDGNANYQVSLVNGITDVNNASILVSKGKALTYNPSTGVLSATCFCGAINNATCFAGCTYAQAKADIRSGLTSCTGTVTSINIYCGTTCKCGITTSGNICLGTNAFNSTAFTTCTGTVTSIKFQCAATDKCTVTASGTINLSANAWNTNATISTTTYPGACCTGTVTKVKVGTTEYSPTSGVISLPAYPSSPSCVACAGTAFCIWTNCTNCKACIYIKV